MTFTSNAPPSTFGAPRPAFPEPAFPEPAYTVDPGPRGLGFFRETLRVVAAKHKMPQSAILGPRRYRELVYARQELVWLLRQARDRTGKHRFSYLTIARWMGQDHTTLIHGYKAHEKRMGAGK